MVDSITAADLKRYRQLVGLSQGQLARTLSVSQPMLSLWEAGRRPIPPARARRLLKLLSELPSRAGRS